MGTLLSLFADNAEDHMNDLQAVFGRMCANEGYTFTIRMNPHSAGHRFIVQVLDGETVIYESKKVRTYVRRNPLTLQPLTKHSPRICDLKKEINQHLAKQKRKMLKPPARTDVEYLKWLLVS